MIKPDILIFMSDQHHAAYAGYAGHNLVKTPHLDKIAENGTVFENAYTSCPLCVPARMSFLTGQLPSRTGIFTNGGAISELQATFIHCLAAEGYETVLCGRMHFMGGDQRHGFTTRLIGDITSSLWGRGGNHRTDLGPYINTFSLQRCLEVIGGGNSPVLEYDRAVVNAALDYLKQKHDKPQCIVVGTYGPHFSYVAPPELYQQYREQVKMPETLIKEVNYRHPVIGLREKKVSDETILSARAAYFGMITALDRQIGAVYEAWKDYLNISQRQGIFIYTSDHGDQAGERYLFGKETFFEGSVGIPLVFEGNDINAGRQLKGPVSIMDIGITLCDIAGAMLPPEQDGASLLRALFHEEDNTDRYVLCEYVEKNMDGQVVPGRMVRQGKWKLISYKGYEWCDLLFDLESDPNELRNLADTESEKLKTLRNLLQENWDPSEIIKEYKIRLKHYDILEKWVIATDAKEKEGWVVPREACKLPEIRG